MSVACIILAGGLGTRLRSVLPALPKCLAPVAGEPFLSWQLRSLRRRGIDRFVLALGHGARQVEDAVARWDDWNIACVTEPHALGTGGAIRFAMSEQRLKEALVANGDTFLGGDLAGMLAPLARADGEHVRMAVVEVPDRQRYGGVAVSPECRVTHFVEKGQRGTGAINAGLYRVHADAFDGIDGDSLSLETVVLPRLAQQQALSAYRIAGPFIDIGIPEDYRTFIERHEHFVGE